MKPNVSLFAGAALGVVSTLCFQRLGNPGSAHPVNSEDARSAPEGKSPRESRTVFEHTLLQFQSDKNLQKAEAGFLRSAELDPSYIPPRVNLAKLAESRADWDAAIQFQQQVALAGEPAVAAKAREDVERLQKLKAEWSTESGRREIQLTRTLSRAMALMESNDFQGASTEAEAAVKIHPDRHEPYVMMAQIALNQGKTDSAKSLLLRAREHAPGRMAPEIEDAIRNIDNDKKASEWVAMGEDAMLKQDFGKAGEYFREAFKLNPHREDLGLRAAMADSLSKKLGGAEVLLQKLVASRNPEIRREATLLLSNVRDLKQFSQGIEKLGGPSEPGSKTGPSGSPAPPSAAPEGALTRKKISDTQPPTPSENKGYRVTGVAGGPGQWLVVLSKAAFRGAPDLVSGPGPWPAKWISQQLSEDYFITNVAGEDGEWVVTMSRGTPFTDQKHFGAGKFSEVDIAGALVDGYRIISVAGSGSSWVVVMAKGTGLGGQRFTLPTEFSRKEDWIKERWDEGYRITTLGGTLQKDGNGVVIVMSEGSGLTDQTYEGPGNFPVDWINQKRNDGYGITSAAGLKDWVVVMSKGGRNGSQVYERQDDFPSKIIQNNR